MAYGRLGSSCLAQQALGACWAACSSSTLPTCLEAPGQGPVQLSLGGLVVVMAEKLSQVCHCSSAWRTTDRQHTSGTQHHKALPSWESLGRRARGRQVGSELGNGRRLHRHRLDSLCLSLAIQAWQVSHVSAWLPAASQPALRPPHQAWQLAAFSLPHTIGKGVRG